MKPKSVKVVFIDEASEIFSRKLEVNDPAQEHYLNTILKRARESGIQLVNLLHHASYADTAHSLIVNSAIKGIIGALGDADTYQEYGATLGATHEEVEYMLRHKAPGIAYFSDHRVGHTFRITFPDISIIKEWPVPEQLIEERLRKILPRMYVTPPVHPDWRPGMPYDWRPEPKAQENNDEEQEKPRSQKKTKKKASVESKATPKTSAKSESQSSTPSSGPAKPKVVISEDALALLKFRAEQLQKHLGPGGDSRTLAGMKLVWKALKISSGRRKVLLLKELEEANLSVMHSFRLGRTDSTVMEITDRGWALLNMEKPVLKGKSGWFHRYLSLVVAQYFRNLSYQVDIEGRLQDEVGKSKAIDVLCKRDDELLGIELALSTSPEQEVENAVQDLLGSTPLSRLIVACRDSAMVQSIKDKMQACPELRLVMDKIEIDLVGRFFK